VTTGYEEVKFLRKNHIFSSQYRKIAFFVRIFGRKIESQFATLNCFVYFTKLRGRDKNWADTTQKHKSDLKGHLRNQSDHSSS